MEVKGIFLGLQHIGVPTRDVKKTVEFYSQFGFETDWADASGSPTFLKCGTCVIETYHMDEVAQCNGGVDHIAIDVSDIEKALEYTRSLGYEPLEGKICDLSVYANGVRYFTILGPNHEKVEFNQKL